MKKIIIYGLIVYLILLFAACDPLGGGVNGLKGIPKKDTIPVYDVPESWSIEIDQEMDETCHDLDISID